MFLSRRRFATTVLAPMTPRLSSSPAKFRLQRTSAMVVRMECTACRGTRRPTGSLHTDAQRPRGAGRGDLTGTALPCRSAPFAETSDVPLTRCDGSREATRPP